MHLALLALLLVQASPAPPAEPPGPEPFTPGALPAAAALVPGVLLHGSGLYVAGDKEGAEALLITEGIGLGAAITGIGLLAATGASRKTAGPLVALTIGGVGLFTTSFLADLYGAAGGARLGGRLGPEPALALEAGYRHVDDPILPYRHFNRLDARWARGDWMLRGGALLGVDEDTRRLEGDLLYRLFSRAAGRLDLRAGSAHHTFEGLESLTTELALEGRAELRALSPSLAGAFFIGELGWAMELRGYEELGVALGEEASELLLARFGLGFGIGESTELAAVYDNRRDGYAGGLNLSEIGSGNTGSLGLSGRYVGRSGWGVALEAVFGAATVTGLDLIYTWGRR